MKTPHVPKVRRWSAEDLGQTMIEYALVTAAISIVLAVTVLGLMNVVETAIIAKGLADFEALFS